MVATIEATFDGKVFRPSEPIALSPNTSVRLTVELLAPPAGSPGSFLETAKALNLNGPADWAANLDSYLYGQETERAG